MGFEFSPAQVEMLERYCDHTQGVPDDDLLWKLTAAVVRMDRTNAGVTQEEVKNWFNERELNKTPTPTNIPPPLFPPKEMEKENKSPEKGKEKEQEFRPNTNGHHHSHSLPTPTFVHTPPRDRREQKATIQLPPKEGTLHPNGSSGPFTRFKEDKEIYGDPFFSQQQQQGREGEPSTSEDELFNEKLTASADKVRLRSRTISSSNLKSILTRSMGNSSSSPLSRSSAKTASQSTLPSKRGEEEGKGVGGLGDPTIFVSRPKKYLEWPEGGVGGVGGEVAVGSGYERDKWDVEVGGLKGGGGEEELLFDELDNLPFYLKEFASTSHTCFGGISETHGPVVISLKSAPQLAVKSSAGATTRGGAYMIIRTMVHDERVVIPFKDTSFTTSSAKKSLLKAFKKHCPQYESLCFTKLTTNPALEKALIDFEGHYRSRTFKFGILCGFPGQGEDEMFGNNEISGRFEEFLGFLGEKVVLEGFGGFKGGLDVRNNTTGTHSLYTTYKDLQIMFHVAPFLPFDPHNPQQLERKRHLGNDIVLIIFQDSDKITPSFIPSAMNSQVNQVFVLVHPVAPPPGMPTKHAYHVNIVNKKGVPLYHPLLPSPPIFEHSEAGRLKFLLKVINADRASMCAPVYRTKLRRTRRQMLENIVNTHSQDS